MNHKNWYHGQLVVEGQMDAGFQYVEDMERSLRNDVAHAAALTTDSPDCTIYGGIVKGSTAPLSYNALKVLNVAACVCVDGTGRRINVPASTLQLTKLGATAQGDFTLAEGTGALVAITNEAWCSVWAVYDEALTDPQTDALGATVYFDIAESFHFHLELGPDATPALNRAALVDGRVLLGDVLLNNAGEIRLIGAFRAICHANQDFKNIAPPYNTMTGRCANWLALDLAASFPAFDALSISLRANTARQALRQLVLWMQDMGAVLNGGGTALLGIEGVAGSASSPAYAVASTTSGGLDAAITYLLNRINSKVSRGQDTMTPPVGTNGLTLDPTTQLDMSKQLLIIKADVGGSVTAHRTWGGRGHISRPNDLWDDFFYAGDAAGQIPFNTEPLGKWGVIPVAGGGTLPALDADGGVARIITNAAVGDAVNLVTGYNNAAGLAHQWWRIGGEPYSCFQVRFRVPIVGGPVVPGQDVRIMIGLADITGDPGIVFQYYDQTTGGVTDLDMHMRAISAAGAEDSTNLGALVLDDWYTLKVQVVSTTEVMFQLKNLSGSQDTLEVSWTPAGTFTAFPNNRYSFVAGVLVNPLGNVSAAGKYLDIDQVYVSAGGLTLDMT